MDAHHRRAISYRTLERRAEVAKMRDRGWYTTSRTRCAVRYAALTNTTISQAAIEFGVNAGGVWHAWERIYPDIEQPSRQTPLMTAVSMMEAGGTAEAVMAITGVSFRQLMGSLKRPTR